jgi:hypothetical protein
MAIRVKHAAGGSDSTVTSATLPSRAEVEAWLADRRGERDLAPSTRAVYRDTLAKLDDDLGQVPLAEITTDDLTGHLDRRYGHTAPATFNRHRATLGSLFAYALLPCTPALH